MKENDHWVVTEMRLFYLQIFLHSNPITDNQAGPFHPCRLVSGGMLGCHRIGNSMDTGQLLYQWSMEGLQSSVDLGFGRIFGKLGEVVLELLPTPEPRLNGPRTP